MTAWYPNRDGAVTRHPEPADWHCTKAVLDLSAPLTRRYTAIHEAGHAIINLLNGIEVRSIEIVNTPSRPTCGFHAAGVTVSAEDELDADLWWASYAAGERAADRWLREQGMWTPERAWAVEREADHDRIQITETMKDAAGRDLEYDTGSIFSLLRIHVLADARLNTAWEDVLDLAEALDRAGSLTGDEIAAAGWLRNPGGNS